MCIRIELMCTKLLIAQTVQLFNCSLKWFNINCLFVWNWLYCFSAVFSSSVQWIRMQIMFFFSIENILCYLWIFFFQKNSIVNFPVEIPRGTEMIVKHFNHSPWKSKNSPRCTHCFVHWISSIFPDRIANESDFCFVNFFSLEPTIQCVSLELCKMLIEFHCLLIFFGNNRNVVWFSQLIALLWWDFECVFSSAPFKMV